MKKYVFIDPYNGINCALVFNPDKSIEDVYFSHGLPENFRKQYENDNYIIVNEEEAIKLGLDIYNENFG